MHEELRGVALHQAMLALSPIGKPCGADTLEYGRERRQMKMG
jgi:hypothetical protein